ncbi:hypothetical protein FQN57_003414 [Myotisia sp. PD_48]|nr:hypothetical protein FQN57_003414 [Myotisia sp. PD_48]
MHFNIKSAVLVLPALPFSVVAKEHPPKPASEAPKGVTFATGGCIKAGEKLTLKQCYPMDGRLPRQNRILKTVGVECQVFNDKDCKGKIGWIANRACARIYPAAKSIMCYQKDNSLLKNPNPDAEGEGENTDESDSDSDSDSDDDDDDDDNDDNNDDSDDEDKEKDSKAASTPSSKNTGASR